MTAEQLDKPSKPKEAAPNKAADKPAAPASAEDQRTSAQKEKARIDQTAGQHLQPVKIDGHDQPKPVGQDPPKPGQDQKKPNQDRTKPAGQPKAGDDGLTRTQ